MSQSQDHYAVLGVSRTATYAEIKAAYRRLALLHHPDKHGGSSVATAKTQQINLAWETLRDTEKRRRYDFEYLGDQHVDMEESDDEDTDDEEDSEDTDDDDDDDMDDEDPDEEDSDKDTDDEDTRNEDKDEKGMGATQERIPTHIEILRERLELLERLLAETRKAGR